MPLCFELPGCRAAGLSLILCLALAAPAAAQDETCPAAPRSDCRASVADGASRLDLEPSSLAWRYNKGASTGKADFGSPLSMTSFAICLYDARGALVGGASLPAGGDCGGKPCWKETKRGYRYADAELRATLQAGDAGKSKLSLRGKAGAVALPSLPVGDDDLPLTVQLLREDGACWGGEHADTRRNDEERFHARNVSGGATTTTSTTSTTSTTTTLPSLDALESQVAPYGDADGDGYANNVELAACSNPADAASTPANDASLCANQTIFSDTLGPAWGSTNRLTDPTYHLAVDALVAQNLADCSAYCASTPNIGSPQACLGAWPWSGVPEYGVYTAGRTVEVNFPDEDGNGIEGRLFLPPGVVCTNLSAPVCDGVTDDVVCSDSLGRTFPAVVISDGFVGVQRMYWWAAHRLAEQGYIAMTFDVSGQGLSQGSFPNGDDGIASDIPGGGGGFSRDIGAAMNFLASASNPVGNLLRVEPVTIPNQSDAAPDHVESYVLGLAGHSAGATAAIAYQQSTEAAYPVRSRAVVAWSHFDAENTIANVPVQLHSGDEDNGFIQPPGSGNRGPEMERRYDRLGGDRDLDGTPDHSAKDRQILMTSAGTHLDYSKVPWAYTPVWAEELEYHYTLAWFDKYLAGDLKRRMGGVSANVIESVDRYADYEACTSGADCFSATERLKMVHPKLSDVWCSRYDIDGTGSADMKGAGCATE